MRPHPDQLAALVAIADHGTFEAAARTLHVTPSAVSQRIRALESAAGRVLLRRTTPCVPTEAGAALLRLARQMHLLYDEAGAALGDEPQRSDLAVAVNADSLATWFREVLGELAGWSHVAVSLHVEDQAYSANLLRSGAVLAAVTSDPVPVQGCTVEYLGTLRYRPAATPEFAEHWRRGRGYDWQEMPVVVFNQKDELQHDVLRERGVTDPSIVHHVPTSDDFREAVRAGLGWGMLPDQQLKPDLASGRLLALSARAHLDLPLHWQRWRLDSPGLARLTATVHRAARLRLRR